MTILSNWRWYRRDELRDFVDKAQDFSASWKMALIVTLLSLIIGIVGSTLHIELRCTAPIEYFWDAASCPAEPDYHPSGLWLFWGAVILFFITFPLRQIAIAHQAERREWKFLAAFRSMPTPDILHAFHGSYKDVLRFISDVVDHKSETASMEHQKENVDKAIRHCLNSLTAQARNLRPNRLYARYAANIMVFMAKDDIHAAGDDFVRDVKDALQWLCPNQSLEDQIGVLFLREELSASTDETSTTAPDQNLNGFNYVLPIPNGPYDTSTGRPRFLPGAPTALEKGHHVIDDTHALLTDYQHTEDFQDLEKSTFNRADKYFRTHPVGQHVRSFLAIRLLDSEGKNAKPIGVVNIHCDIPNIFDEEWVLLTYLYLTTPTLARIAELLVKRQELERAAGAGT